MDFNNQKLLKGQNDNISEAEDRISKLPDSLLHYILSFHGTRFCARTSVLSKRWNHIWTCIPTLDFLTWDYSDHSSLSKDKFMDFVHRTLLLRDTSNIQKFSLFTKEHSNASQVHSWITCIARRGVQELSLNLDLDKPFFIPVSLFTCETLVKLDLCANSAIHFPKSFSFPKLKSLEILGIRFTDDNCWNEQQFSNFPVLEKLILEDCTWVGVRKFCILSPSLKDLQITNGTSGEGLQDCDLKIYAPSLVSLDYLGHVAKDYDLSIFKTLDKAVIYFNGCHARSEQWIGYGGAVTKFFRAISFVQNLMIDVGGLQDLLNEDDFTNDLPTFHNLNELDLQNRGATYFLVFALLKAASNLKSHVFNGDIFYDDCYYDDDDDDDSIAYDGTEDLFQNLQSVEFDGFCGAARELRWVKLILMNAKHLQTMTIAFDDHAEDKEVVISELSSLPRSSGRCVFKFV